MGIYIRISFLGLQPRYAIYIAFMSIVGFNIGAKAYKRVQKIMMESFLLMFGIVLVLTVIMVLWSSEIASIFTTDADFAKITGDMSIWGLVGNPFNGPLVLASGIYQMEGKSLQAIGLQLARLVLIIAGLYAVPYILDVKYILLGFSFADFVTGILGTVVFFIQRRRYKELEIREQKDKYVERN